MKQLYDQRERGWTQSHLLDCEFGEDSLASLSLTSFILRGSDN